MKDIEKLKKIAKNTRIDIVNMIHSSKSGHLGGSLSCVEILVALYHDIMNLNLDKKNNRIDKFVLSKGHAAPAYYSILSSVGYIPHEDLNTLRKFDSYLEGHPSNKINGVDVSSGSLGQGLSVASGMAIAKKTDNEEGFIYCLLGDGEIQEGQFYEALMTINKYNLSNLILIIDKNGLQIDGTTEEVKPSRDLKVKIESFGINVQEIDGHDFNKILDSIQNAKQSNKPNCIIANTVKGKGVSFMENQVSWHGKAMSEEEYKLAISELK